MFGSTYFPGFWAYLFYKADKVYFLAVQGCLLELYSLFIQKKPSKSSDNLFNWSKYYELKTKKTHTAA